MSRVSLFPCKSFWARYRLLLVPFIILNYVWHSSAGPFFLKTLSGWYWSCLQNEVSASHMLCPLHRPNNVSPWKMPHWAPEWATQSLRYLKKSFILGVSDLAQQQHPFSVLPCYVCEGWAHIYGCNGQLAKLKPCTASKKVIRVYWYDLLH